MTTNISDMLKDATKMKFNELEQGVQYLIDAEKTQQGFYRNKKILISVEGNTITAIPLTETEQGIILDLVVGQEVVGKLDLREVEDFIDPSRFTLYTLSMLAILKEMYKAIGSELYDEILEDIKSPKRFPKASIENSAKFITELDNTPTMPCSATISGNEYCYEVTKIGEQEYKFKLNTLSKPLAHYKKTGVATFEDLKHLLVSMIELDFATNLFVKFFYYPETLRMRDVITVYGWSELVKLKQFTKAIGK